MKTLKIGFLLVSLLLGLLPSVMAQTARPYPTADTPKAIDLGELKAGSGTTPISITIALHLRDVNGAEDLLKSINTPGDAQYHQFLTAEQFVTRFAPSDADIANVSAALGPYGLTVERTTATTLKVTGLPAAMENTFSVSLHSYEVPAHGSVPSYTYHAPLSAPTIPAEISASVSAVVGLDSRPTFHPGVRTVPPTVKVASAAPQTTTTPDQPGYWTVIDFADYYNVNPLYRRGLTGRGHTLGIITLASFTPSDAFAYWSALGLKVDPNRLTVVNVDGGPGAPSDASGSVETTLDVEQSGGIAPSAKIIVYQAPNTDQGFVDLFAAAVEANSAETLSTSWSSWEWFFNFENGPVTDPITGQTVSFIRATHELLLRGAIQGQTLFGDSGDGGAYSVNWNLGCFGPYSASQPYSCSQPLTVQYPSTDPAMTAAGGTTIAALLELCQNQACTPPYYDITIRHERVWGWDYLIGFCEAVYGEDPIACGIFPIGSTGGVSVFFHLPRYQFSLPGTQLSQPGQVWEAGSGIAAELGSPGPPCCAYFALPAYYRGRNVPDVSFNADPETGYVIYYTSEPSGVSGILTYYGGTSFVGPQLNGVSALLGEDLHSRLGLLNYPLYDLAQNGEAYGGPDAPLHAIRYGDNWFYHGSDGYNPAAGLGTLDVANFARVLRHRF